MMCVIKIAIFVIILLFHITYADQSMKCGDWYVYKDEKCFKLMDKLDIKTYDDAKKTYYENEESSLVTIRSQEEQDFLYNLLKNSQNNVIDVWIGAQFSDQRLKWSENVTENYTNWANGYPINDSGYECVLMKMVEPSHGKWLNEPCIRNHSVVCQNQQNWLFSYLQKNMMDLKESFKKYVEHTNAELDKTKKDLETIKTDLADAKSKLENTEYMLLQTHKERQFYIKNIDTGLVLDIKEANRKPNAEIIMYSYNGGRNQLWEYRNGMIQSALNNYVLDISQGDGRSVITYTANGNPWQKWYFDADNTIRCEFRNLVLDVEQKSRDESAKVIAYPKNNDTNQWFRIFYV